MDLEAFEDDLIDLRVDVLDDDGVWNPAKVLKVHGQSAFIRYDGWGNQFNEWVKFDTDHIAPIHSYTVPIKCWVLVDRMPWWPAIMTVRLPGTNEGRENLKKEPRLNVIVMDHNHPDQRTNGWLTLDRFKPLNNGCEERIQVINQVISSPNSLFYKTPLQLLKMSTAQTDIPSFIKGTYTEDYDKLLSKSDDIMEKCLEYPLRKWIEVLKEQMILENERDYIKLSKKRVDDRMSISTPKKRAKISSTNGQIEPVEGKEIGVVDKKPKKDTFRAIFRVGDKLDVLDAFGVWNMANVVDTNFEDICVHFYGWEESWDEWITKCSPRLAPLSTYTFYTKCFAKIPYYPPWPSLVNFRYPGSKKGERGLRSETKLWVEFLDNELESRRTRCWVDKKDILTIKEGLKTKERILSNKRNRHRKGFITGLNLLEKMAFSDNLIQLEKGTLPLDNDAQYNERNRMLKKFRIRLGTQEWRACFVKHMRQMREAYEVAKPDKKKKQSSKPKDAKSDKRRAGIGRGGSVDDGSNNEIGDQRDGGYVEEEDPQVSDENEDSESNEEYEEDRSVPSMRKQRATARAQRKVSKGIRSGDSCDEQNSSGKGGDLKSAGTTGKESESLDDHDATTGASNLPNGGQDVDKNKKQPSSIESQGEPEMEEHANDTSTEGSRHEDSVEKPLQSAETMINEIDTHSQVE